MQQIREMIAQREAAIATLQAELDALRLTASLLARQEDAGAFALNLKPSEKAQNDVFGSASQPAEKTNSAKSQFV